MQKRRRALCFFLMKMTAAMYMVWIFVEFSGLSGTVAKIMGWTIAYIPSLYLAIPDQ
jgi:hypothetical protein